MIEEEIREGGEARVTAAESGSERGENDNGVLMLELWEDIGLIV